MNVSTLCVRRGAKIGVCFRPGVVGRWLIVFVALRERKHCCTSGAESNLTNSVFSSIALLLPGMNALAMVFRTYLTHAPSKLWLLTRARHDLTAVQGFCL